MSRMTRHFLYVGGRRVHYRRIGAGPPVVLVHSSPANSEYLIPFMQALAPSCTCFAFDNPGFGDSEALDLETIHVADLADALAGTLAHLGMPPCPVFGTHTGAAIAVELARRHPAQVRGLVVDAIAIFDRVEQEMVLAEYDTPQGGYMMKIEPDALGGHWARLWTRFRDQLIWFPWTSHAAADLQTADIRSPEQVHSWMMMMLRAGNHYRSPYRAAWTYGFEAIEALSEIRTPAIYMARRRDMLFPHLDRFPPLRPNQSMIRLEGDMDEYVDTIRGALVGLLGDVPPPEHLQGAGCAGAVTRRFMGGLFLREWLAPQAGGRTLLALHDVPGTSHSLEPLAALGGGCSVVAPDLPGTGDSDPLEGAPDLDAFAHALWPLIEELPAGFDLYGRGFGATLAVAVAARWPERVGRLILDGVLLPDAALAAEMATRLAPPITLGADGAHWFRTWQALRDGQIYWPWYRTEKAALRRSEGIFAAQALHDWTFEVMKQPQTYGQLVPACLASPLEQVLPTLKQPVLVLKPGVAVLDRFAERAASLCRDGALAARTIPIAPPA